MTPDGVQQALQTALRRRPPVLHVMRERDVGLFSLIQQVIANVPWAVAEGRVPVVDFRDRTCYWTRGGHRGGESVWEYYFEPLVQGFPASTIGPALRRRIEARYPDQAEPGDFIQPDVFVTNHYGEHPSLIGKALQIPYETGNPGQGLRQLASEIIRTLIRPRGYVKDKAALFHETFMAGADVIGVHVRGTDAVSSQETRDYRKGSLNLERYERVLTDLLAARPAAKLLIATDAESSLDRLSGTFGERVLAYGSVRHRAGAAAGRGPTGCIMPAYIAADPALAAQNGEDAIVEYLLLARCSHLVHNGAGLATTVLLANPSLDHTNTHRGGLE